MKTGGRTALAGAGLFLLTALLVRVGALSFVDRYAVSHLMPWYAPANDGLIASVTLPTPHGSWPAMVFDVWVYPASVLPSALLVLLAASALRRRGERDAAVRWCALWITANAVELLGKALVARPALFWHGMHVTAFDHSLPSGHTLRSLVVAASLAYTWRRGRLALLWAASVVVILVPLGWHTPTDVAAGLFAFVALLGWAPKPRTSRSRG